MRRQIEAMQAAEVVRGGEILENFRRAAGERRKTCAVLARTAVVRRSAAIVLVVAGPLTAGGTSKTAILGDARVFRQQISELTTTPLRPPGRGDEQ